MEQIERLKYKKVFGYEDRNAGMKLLTELINMDKSQGTGGHFMMNDNPDEYYEKPYQFFFMKD